MSKLARPGYAIALLVLIAGLTYVLTESLWGMMVIAALEAVFWAATQYFQDRRRRFKRI
jgi:uncharacterized membrane protein